MLVSRFRCRYVVVGSAGYLMFRTHVRGDVLTNLGSDGERSASLDDILKFFYGLTSLATVPILLLPIKACVFSMPLVKKLNRNNGPGALSMNKRGLLHCTIAVSALAVALVCATLIPNIEYVYVELFTLPPSPPISGVNSTEKDQEKGESDWKETDIQVTAIVCVF